MQDSKRDVEIEQRIGKFVRDFSIAVQDEQSVNYNILRKMLRELLASEISKAKEPRLTQKEVSFINRLMVADRYGEDETIKTKNNTLNSEEWEALLVKLESELSKLTTK